jgi:hypothetical protein
VAAVATSDDGRAQRNHSRGKNRRKEQRRIPLNPSSAPAPAPGWNGDGKKSGSGGGGKRGPSRAADASSAEDSDGFESDWLGNDEGFFRLFIFKCDSHRLNALLQAVMCAELQKLNAPAQVAQTAQHSPSLFPRRLTAAKLLAKFLGLLAFSPHFFSDDHAFTDGSSQALNTAMREAVDALNSIGWSPITQLDECLVEGASAGTLCFTVPWVCSFLVVAKRDHVSKSTKVYRSCLRRLARIRHCLDRESSTSLFVVGQIEQLFHALEEPLAFEHPRRDDQEDDRADGLVLCPAVVDNEVLQSPEFLRMAWPLGETIRLQLARALSSSSTFDVKAHSARPRSR